ncbi:tripartite tricarboxylate transporter substrate binding protein [Cupriavidus sp. TMH.W2]|uniref:tripartite tricarboxylate transporter substrate binding protein n=1 Tax=Cupriavidus sp. TMH.W2 TaxID=3434465 RepID=UPI003D76C0BE
MNRRDFGRLSVIGLTSTLGCSLASRAIAQDGQEKFPDRPIRVLLGFPPGGSTDTPMRVLTANASKILGQPLVIETKPGAAGVLPAQILQSTKPDGYTLAVIPQGVFRLPYTTDISWNPADLSFIIGVTGYVFGIVVPASSPIKSMSDYIAYAKAHPGELTYSTPGSVTTNHLTMEQISRVAGIKLTHVPYKGTGESLQALLGGHVMSAAETAGWQPYVESGKMRLLAVWGEKRMPRFPNVPTLKECGINIVQSSPWGIAAPKGTPSAIIAKLHAAFKQAMEEKNFRDALAQYDMEPMYMSPEQYRRFAISAMAREKATLEQIGYKKNSG